MNLTSEILYDATAPVVDPKIEVYPHLDRMREIMRTEGYIKGIGLAAPQVGLSARFFITDLPGLHVVINPTFRSYSGRTVSAREGCLSFPERTRFVKRDREIVVQFTNRKGKSIRRRLEGHAARVFQHEFDHLQGVCIF